MSDNKFDEEFEKFWSAHVASKQPFTEMIAHKPIKLSIAPSGGLNIDYPLAVSGDPRAGLMRMRLDVPVAALKAALEFLEQHPDKIFSITSAQNA